MKKLLLLSFLAISLSSCDKDDDKECICKNAKYKSPDRETYFYFENMPIDCETGQPLKETGAPEAVYVGCED